MYDFATKRGGGDIALVGTLNYPVNGPLEEESSLTGSDQVPDSNMAEMARKHAALTAAILPRSFAGNDDDQDFYGWVHKYVMMIIVCDRFSHNES